MSWFRRKGQTDTDGARDERAGRDESDEGTNTEDAAAAATSDGAKRSDPREDDRGPWDLDEEPELGSRVDLGALRVPARQGMAVRMEMERSSKRVVAVNVGLDGSALQIQAFAAPRTDGLWDELRAEIAESIGKQGGTAEETEGPFGTELLARLPVRTPEGRSGHRPARFIGVDGPRWFVRGVLTGKAATDAEAAGVMEGVLADVVVVRGHDPRPPRDLLPLHLPGKPGEEVDQPASTRPVLDLGGGRGPEITEVH